MRSSVSKKFDTAWKGIKSRARSRPKLPKVQAAQKNARKKVKGKGKGASKVAKARASMKPVARDQVPSMPKALQDILQSPSAPFALWVGEEFLKQLTKTNLANVTIDAVLHAQVLSNVVSLVADSELRNELEMVIDAFISAEDEKSRDEAALLTARDRMTEVLGVQVFSRAFSSALMKKLKEKKARETSDEVKNAEAGDLLLKLVKALKPRCVFYTGFDRKIDNYLANDNISAKCLTISDLIANKIEPESFDGSLPVIIKPHGDVLTAADAIPCSKEAWFGIYGLDVNGKELAQESVTAEATCMRTFIQDAAKAFNFVFLGETLTMNQPITHLMAQIQAANVEAKSEEVKAAATEVITLDEANKEAEVSTEAPETTETPAWKHFALVTIQAPKPKTKPAAAKKKKVVKKAANGKTLPRKKSASKNAAAPKAKSNKSSKSSKTLKRKGSKDSTKSKKDATAAKPKKKEVVKKEPEVPAGLKRFEEAQVGIQYLAYRPDAFNFQLIEFLAVAASVAGKSLPTKPSELSELCGSVMHKGFLTSTNAAAFGYDEFVASVNFLEEKSSVVSVFANDVDSCGYTFTERTEEHEDSNTMTEKYGKGIITALNARQALVKDPKAAPHRILLNKASLGLKDDKSPITEDQANTLKAMLDLERFELRLVSSETGLEDCKLMVLQNGDIADLVQVKEVSETEVEGVSVEMSWVEWNTNACEEKVLLFERMWHSATGSEETKDLLTPLVTKALEKEKALEETPEKEEDEKVEKDEEKAPVKKESPKKKAAPVKKDAPKKKAKKEQEKAVVKKQTPKKKAKKAAKEVKEVEVKKSEEKVDTLDVAEQKAEAVEEETAKKSATEGKKPAGEETEDEEVEAAKKRGLWERISKIIRFKDGETEKTEEKEAEPVKEKAESKKKASKEKSKAKKKESKKEAVKEESKEVANKEAVKEEPKTAEKAPVEAAAKEEKVEPKEEEKKASGEKKAGLGSKFLNRLKGTKAEPKAAATTEEAAKDTKVESVEQEKVETKAEVEPKKEEPKVEAKKEEPKVEEKKEEPKVGEKVEVVEVKAEEAKKESKPKKEKKEKKEVKAKKAKKAVTPKNETVEEAPEKKAGLGSKLLSKLKLTKTPAPVDAKEEATTEKVEAEAKPAAAVTEAKKEETKV